MRGSEECHGLSSCHHNAEPQSSDQIVYPKLQLVVFYDKIGKFST